MKLSAKAQAKLNEMVTRFERGGISPIMAVTKNKLAADAPAHSWSFGNRVLAFAQTDNLDCRTYNQWQAAGRQVKKGEAAGFIFKPYLVKDEKNPDKMVCVGFGTVPVFGYAQTEPLDPDDKNIVSYEPATLPPLADVAAKFGIKVNYSVTTANIMGSCTVDGKNITLGTTDTKTFFHELAHAVHATFEKLAGAQTEYQETVAEFTATVLMDIYGLGDYTGNAWNYIKHYADDPLKAITKALDTIGKVIDTISTATA